MGNDKITCLTWEYKYGEETEISHKWSDQGTYILKVNEKDISDYERLGVSPLRIQST